MKPIVPMISQSFRWRFLAHHSFRRMTITLAVVLAYGVLFIPLFLFWGDWISFLSIIPIVMAGWFFGPAFGVFSCFLMLMLNLMLWNIMGVDANQWQFVDWVILNLVGGGLLGYVAGRAGDQHYERKPVRRQGEGQLSDPAAWPVEIPGEFEAPVSSLLDFFPAPAFTVNRQGQICGWNTSLENLTGIPAQEVLGKDSQRGSEALFGKKQPMLVEFVSSKQEDLEKQFPGVKKENLDLVLETYIPDFKPGGAYLFMKARPIYNLDGVQVGAIQYIQDVTELRLAQEREGLIEQHDSATGLFTQEYLEKEIARLERNHTFPSSILLVRLLDDSALPNARRLKLDELLRRTGAALKGNFRSNDIVTYIGERDFAILLPRADAIAAQRLSERLRKSLSLRSLGRFEPLLQFNVVAVTSLESGTLLETFNQGRQLLSEI